ncbi:MAG: DUF4238 domain-containing protein [Blastocatellia bacterium]
MAGKRQHIFPRFLLKGFASRISGEEVFTWVYRKEGKVFETNIINVSVEQYFYGKQGEVTIDAEITELESEFGILLDELRRKNDQTPVSNLKVAELVTHLCIRTKHLRDSFRESSEFLIERISEYLFDTGNLKSIISNNPELIRNEFDKVVRQYPFLEPFKDMVVNQGASTVAALLEQYKPGIQVFVQEFIEGSRDVLPRAVKEGHIKALAKGLVPEPRAEEYRLLEWFICKSGTPLILGDMGCLFETSGARRFKSINEKGDQLKNIFLPISSDRLLIGTSLSSVPEIDTNQINEILARCSREYFVCPESSSSKLDLIPLIGKESEIISGAEVEQLVKELAEVIREYGKSNRDA